MILVSTTASQLKQLCTLLMVNDPWPAGVDQDEVVAVVNELAKSHGYTDWVDAYHKL